MKTLETERLILRAWKLEDAADVFAYASGSRVGPMAGWKPHETLAETKELLRNFIEQDDTWAVEYKESRKVIGSVGLHSREREGIAFDRELGYVLSEDYWGRGIMPEAVSAVIRFAFEELGINTLLASHFSFNRQSERVIRKSGFRYLKHAAESWRRYDGAVLDEELYLLERADYPFEIGRWMECFIKEMMAGFSDRVAFIGLQGSRARGEANEDSDIDAVLILERRSPEDLKTYREALRKLPWNAKACGFFSDLETLLCWDRADLFQLYYDTTPYFGSLELLRPLIGSADILRAVRIGACNLCHACTHNALYGGSRTALAGLYKAAVFVLQAERFYETGVYLRRRSELLPALSGRSAEILRIAELLRENADLSEAAFERYSALLQEWAGELIRKYAEIV